MKKIVLTTAAFFIGQHVVSAQCQVINKSIHATPTTICQNGSSTFTVPDSEMGVEYYLRDNADNSIVDGPVIGNESDITLNTGSISASNSYNVYASKEDSFAVNLPGSLDRVDFPDPGASFTNEITIETWVYSDDVSKPAAGQSSLNVDNISSNVWLWDRAGAGGEGSFLVNNGAQWFSIDFPSFTNPGWNHVATVANTDGMFIYYNGVEVASSAVGLTGNIVNNPSSVISLGHDPRYTNESGRNSNKAFEDFRVWNVARTAEQIADNYNTCLTGSESGLVHYTTFNEGTGTAISSVVGNDGEIINPTINPWTSGKSICTVNCDFVFDRVLTINVNTIDELNYTANPIEFCDSGDSDFLVENSEVGVKYYLRDDSDNSIVEGPVEGNGGTVSFNTGNITTTTTYNIYAEHIDSLYAVNLPASNDYVNFNDPFVAYTNEITIEAWVNSSTDEIPWIGQSTPNVDNGTNSNVWLWEASGSFFIFDNGTSRSLAFPDFPNAGWNHVATVAKADSMLIYYNGELVQSEAVGITDVLNNPNSIITLGQDPRYLLNTDRNSNAAFDDFRVWNVARTAGEIAESYMTCLTGSETGLVQQTTFNDAINEYIHSDIGSVGSLVNASTNNWITGTGVCNLICDLEMSTTTTVSVNNTPDNTVSVDGATLTADAAGATYQWLDCDNGNTPISGATEQSFSPTENGNYAVEINSNGCLNTSECIAVTTVNVDNEEMGRMVVYPNPTNGELSIDLGATYDNVSISVIDALGKVIQSEKYSSAQKIDLNISGEKGIYFVEIVNKENLRNVIKVIKK